MSTSPPGEDATSAGSDNQTASVEAKHDDIDAVPTLEGMGLDQLLDVLAFLPLADRVRVHMTCRHLRSQQEVGDASIRALCFDQHGFKFQRRLFSSFGVKEDKSVAQKQRPAIVLRRSRELQWSRLGNLRELNVGGYCTDRFLSMISGANSEIVCAAEKDPRGGKLIQSPFAIRNEMLLPSLEILRISPGPPDISEDALLFLTKRDGSGRIRSALREVDVISCHEITYNAVIQFRALLPNCLLRRLPDWMCGHIITPFGENGISEVHTYWPDGSFSFNRDNSSKGFVRQIDLVHNWIYNEYHVYEKLQFINFSEHEMPTWFRNAHVADEWPTWFRNAYRPSVSVLRLDAERVLIAQRLGGLKHLDYFPKKDHAGMVPIGSSKSFDLKGQILSDEIATIALEESDFEVVKVSHMRKRPLSKEVQFSPACLVKEISAYLENIQLDEGVRRRSREDDDTGIEYAEDLVDRAFDENLDLLNVFGWSRREREEDFMYDDNMVAVPINREAVDRSSS